MIFNHKNTEKLTRLVIQKLTNEFRAQGHSLTGTAEKSIESEILPEKIIFWGIHYLQFLETGVHANKIPYNPGSGATTSKYIAGLIDFAKKRFGVSGKSARSAAFAIAKKQKSKDNPPFGMPTRNSMRFSKTGKRTQFISETLNKNQSVIQNEIMDINYNILKIKINSIIDGINKTNITS